jgi:hypothetical protein
MGMEWTRPDTGTRGHGDAEKDPEVTNMNI